MLCPVCNVDLVMSDRSGVEIDYCPKCRGVWLDRGELLTQEMNIIKLIITMVIIKRKREKAG